MMSYLLWILVNIATILDSRICGFEDHSRYWICDNHGTQIGTYSVDADNTEWEQSGIEPSITLHSRYLRTY